MHHLTAVIRQDRQRQHQKQTSGVLSRPRGPAWHIRCRRITGLEHNHLHIMLCNECLDQGMIRMQMRFKIAIERPILITVSEPKVIKPTRHHQILQAWLVGKNVAPFADPYQRLDQSALVIHLFTTLYDQQIRLLGSKMTTKSPATASMTPALGPSSDSCVTMLAETVLHLQFLFVGPHTAKSS